MDSGREGEDGGVGKRGDDGDNRSEIGMMRSFCILVFALCCAVSYSATLRGVVADEKDEPLPYANITVGARNITEVSDANGRFAIEGVETGDVVEILFTGYEEKNIIISEEDLRDGVSAKLAPIRLDEVQIVRKNGLTNSRQKVIQTQTIGAGELVRAACCNLSESFQTNPSVDVSYSDAATGARQIRLLGLSGAYVSTTFEKIPAMKGLSFPFGLTYLPSLWMSSIQISKGAGSVVDGFDAISGQINIEMRKPQAMDKFYGSLFVNSMLMTQADAIGGFKISDSTSTALFAHFTKDFKCFDHDKDKFMDMPQATRGEFYNRWFVSRGILRSQIGVKYIGEKRTSGQTEEADKPLWKSEIETNRAEFWAKNGFIIDPSKDRSIGIILSANLHKQKATFGRRPYNATEGDIYLNAIYQTDFGKAHSIKTGVSNYTSILRENAVLDAFDVENEYEKRTTSATSGVFCEYTYKIRDMFTAVAGVRCDYDSYFKDVFCTPRLHLMYSPCDVWQIRGSAGLGSRKAYALAENISAFASARKIVITETLKRENAANCGASVSFTPDLKHDFSLTAEYYYTYFLNQAVYDYDKSADAVFVGNLAGKSYSHTAQIEAKYEFVRGLSLLAAYRMTKVMQTTDGRLRQKIMTPLNKGLATLCYEPKLRKWQFDLTAQINGGGRLPDAGKAERWKERYGAFPILNIQVARRFRYAEVFAGCENITGYRQKNAIICADNPFGQGFDAGMVYAPLDGRKVYVSARFNLD